MERTTLKLHRTGHLNFKVVRGKPALSEKFGALQFFSQKWISHSNVRLPFFVDALSECRFPYDELIAEFFLGAVHKPAIVREGNTVFFLFDPVKLIFSHLHERSLAQKRPFYLRIPFVYDLTSAGIHFAIYKIVSSFSKLAHGIGPRTFRC